MLPDYEGCLALLAAVVRQDLKEARTPEELASLADWLGMTPAQLQRRQAGQQRIADRHGRRCPGCGRVLPEHNAGASGAGRQRVWCSDGCRQKTKRAGLTRGCDNVP